MSNNITRHVGKVKNTGVRCVVVLRKMPGSPTSNIAEDRDHALIIETEALPDMYHDNIMTVVNSNESQQTHDLYSVLSRRTFGDGNNMINALHTRGHMRKVSVDDVILYPMPNQPLPLRMANDAIDGVTSTPATADAIVDMNSTATPVDVNTSTARSLLMQAELLDLDAAKKREEAYTIDPTLRPQVGRPGLSAEEKELRRIERNAKRRENYSKGEEASE